MTPGRHKISCLFLLGETPTTGTVSKHQYGAHISPVPSSAMTLSYLWEIPRPRGWLGLYVCVNYIPRDQTRQPVKTNDAPFPPMDSSLPVSRNGTIRESRSAKGGKSIASTQYYARR